MASNRRQRKIVRDAAKKYKIPASTLWGVYGAESNFGKNKNRSSAGAQGPFQFMPRTAKGMGVNPRSFKSSAYGAAKYLSQYKGRGLRGMLAAYNAGPAGNPNNPETRAYVPRVRQLARGYKDPGGGKDKREGGRLESGIKGRLSMKTTKIPGVDLSEERKQRKLQYFTGDERYKPDALLSLASDLRDLEDVPSSTKVRLERGEKRRGQRYFPPKPLDNRYSERVGDKRWIYYEKRNNQWKRIGSGPKKMAGRWSKELEGGSRPHAVRRAQSIAKAVARRKPAYKWGGGHGAKTAPIGADVDCSGFVSQVLGVSPRVSGQFAKFGRPGKGKHITIYANSGHVLLSIDGVFYGTSRSNPGGGAGKIAKPSASYLSNFTVRHPRGL